MSAGEIERVIAWLEKGRQRAADEREGRADGHDGADDRQRLAGAVGSLDATIGIAVERLRAALARGAA